MVAVYIACHDLQSTGGRSYTKDLCDACSQLESNRIPRGSGGTAFLDFYSCQIRFLIAVEIRDGEVGVASQRRGRRVLRRSAGGIRPTNHTSNQTQDQKGFASGCCCAEIFTHLEKHKL